jgi:hypothetical protein
MNDGRTTRRCCRPQSCGKSPGERPGSEGPEPSPSAHLQDQGLGRLERERPCPRKPAVASDPSARQLDGDQPLPPRPWSMARSVTVPAGWAALRGSSVITTMWRTVSLPDRGSRGCLRDRRGDAWEARDGSTTRADDDMDEARCDGCIGLCGAGCHVALDGGRSRDDRASERILGARLCSVHAGSHRHAGLP